MWIKFHLSLGKSSTGHSVKNYLWPFTLLIAVICLDQVSKGMWASAESIHFNEGIIFGLFADVSANLRIITLCCFGGFLLTFYCAILFFIPRKMKLLKAGMSLLIGGVLGNVIDRMLTGQTVDFIPAPWMQVSFNVADVFQWIGALIIFIQILKRGSEIWHPENQRGRYLILPHEQLLFSLKLLIITFTTAVMLGIFSITFLNVLLGHADLAAERSTVLLNFSLAYVFITLIVSLFSFIFGIYVSHRSAGPVHAFALFVDDLTQGKLRDFKLRDRDHFKELEHIAKKLQEQLRDS